MILNRLKNAVNPLVVVQIYILKYLECHNEESIVVDVNKTVKEVKVINDNSVVTKKDSKNEKKYSFKINEEVKQIRINNSMAEANIHYKKEMTKVWDNLQRYFMDEKYGKESQLLSDTLPMVVGSEYAIIECNHFQVMATGEERMEA